MNYIVNYIINQWNIFLYSLQHAKRAWNFSNISNLASIFQNTMISTITNGTMESALATQSSCLCIFLGDRNTLLLKSSKMWNHKWSNNFRIYHCRTHEFWMIQPNKEWNLDNKVKWNKFSNEAKDVFENGYKRKNDPVSQPLCVFCCICTVKS